MECMLCGSKIMKKIRLLLSCTPEYGGTYQYNLNILDAVASFPLEQFEVVIHYMHQFWEKELKSYSCMKVHTPTIDRLFENYPCDLWIFPSQESLGYQKPVPVLSTIHDLMHRYEKRFPEVSENGEYESREESYLNICRYTKGVLVDSEVGKRHVQECYGLPDDQIFILPYIPPKYIYKYETISDFDDRYKLPPKFIFYPAHFWQHKNHVGLISAIDLLKEELPDLHLVLVGSKHNGYEKVLQCVEELNLGTNVHLIGHVPNQDIPEFYRRARAIVMPTFFGPTNIPSLEAFVMGCPAATSSVYGIPDQVGDAALLFNPESINEIAYCVKRLWTDDKLCRSLVEKGKKRAALWGEVQFNKRLLEIVEHMTTS